MDLSLRINNRARERLTAPAAISLVSQVLVLFLKKLHLPPVMLELSFSFVSIVFGVDFGAFFKMVFGVSLCQLLILIIESEHLGKKMVFGDFRVGAKRLITELRCILKPIYLLCLFKTKLFRHKNEYINLSIYSLVHKRLVTFINHQPIINLYFKIMNEFPSGGLTESQMVDHIKFIAKDLFPEGVHSLSTLKHPVWQNQNRNSEDPEQYQLFYQTNEFFDRNNSRRNYPVTQQKKKKKMPIFKDVDQFLQRNQTINKNNYTQIPPKINQNFNSRFSDQTLHIHEQKQWKQSRKKQKQTNEQLWSIFLKRESQWLLDKKRLYHHIEFTQKNSRNSISSERAQQRFDSSPNKAKYRQLNEVQQSIAKLRRDAETLKMKIMGRQEKQTSLAIRSD